jgi:hypothetical protein
VTGTGGTGANGTDDSHKSLKKIKGVRTLFAIRKLLADMMFRYAKLKSCCKSWRGGSA